MDEFGGNQMVTTVCLASTRVGNIPSNMTTAALAYTALEEFLVPTQTLQVELGGNLARQITSSQQVHYVPQLQNVRVYTRERPYQCTECPKSFTSNTTLKNHLKIHKGEFAYKCEICKRGFVCNSWLQDHYKVHTGEKPFQCDDCSKWFKDKSYIERHKTKYCMNDGYKKVIIGRNRGEKNVPVQNYV